MNRIRFLGKTLLAVLLCFTVIRVAMHFSQDFRFMVYHVRDYVITAQFFPITPKFWAHRCNDTRKMEEMMTKYKGVELDIIFYPTKDGGSFEVSHDPQPALEHPLDSFFALLASSQGTNCWLDLKNLNKRTAKPALRELERLVTKYQIDKKQLILESSNYAFLGAFRRQGYYTSYYCPVNDKRYLDTNAHKKEFMRLVNNAVKSGNVDAVSFPISYYSLIKGANVGVDYLTWYVGHRGWIDFYFDQKLKSVLQDKQVKVILVTANSRYNR